MAESGGTDGIRQLGVGLRLRREVLLGIGSTRWQGDDSRLCVQRGRELAATDGGRRDLLEVGEVGRPYRGTGCRAQGPYVTLELSVMLARSPDSVAGHSP